MWQFLVGALVAVVLVAYVKFRNTRTMLRNNDPLNIALMEAFLQAADGRLSNSELDQMIDEISEQANSSTFGVVGDTMKTRFIHVSTMFPWYSNADKDTIKLARKLIGWKSNLL